MVVKRLRLPVALLAVLLLCGSANFAAAHRGGVVLGSKDFAPNGFGFGHRHPHRIFNGGVPSGLVTNIHWKHWGNAVAIGYGRTPIYKPSGGYFAHKARIKLRASSLGRCDGRRGYSRLHGRVPLRPGGPLTQYFLWAGAPNICRSFP
jgi:hypothetical protein